MTGRKKTPLLFCMLGISLTALLILPARASAGKLSVGTKVIYPGGADQPPLEKDTGVVFRAEALSVATTNKADSEDPLADELEELDDNGDYEALLSIVSQRTDPLSQTYKAIALYRTDKTSEAEELARQLLTNKRLAPELRDKLLYELDLSDEELEAEKD